MIFLISASSLVMNVDCQIHIVFPIIHR